jgi:integrase
MKGKAQKRIGKGGTVTYTVVVDLPRDPATGKRRQKRLSAATARELKVLQAKVLNELNEGEYVEPAKMTLREYLDRWLDTIKSSVRPSTHDRYGRIVRGHLIPGLGGLALSKLAPLHVQTYYAGELQAGGKATSVALYHAVLHRALDQALRWHLVSRNVSGLVEVPRGQSPEMRTWSAAQARVFLSTTTEDPLHTLWRLALMTGLRRGELLVLRWQDLDLDRQAARIRRTLTRTAAGWEIGDPKTGAGRRQVALPALCVTALQAHRDRQFARRAALGDAWHDEDLVFERGDGHRLEPRTVQRTFVRLVERSGLPRVRFHDLRHTAATLMLANGEHPKIVQERLGHSSIKMTLDRYSHVTMDMQHDAAQRLEDLLAD